MQETITSVLVLGIAVLGVVDIVSLRVERLFFAAGDAGAAAWNEAQRAIAHRYWWGRCLGGTLLLVVPGLLAFFKVLPAWTAFAWPLARWLMLIAAGLALVMSLGLLMLRLIPGGIPWRN